MCFCIGRVSQGTYGGIYVGKPDRRTSKMIRSMDKNISFVGHHSILAHPLNDQSCNYRHLRLLSQMH